MNRLERAQLPELFLSGQFRSLSLSNCALIRSVGVKRPPQTNASQDRQEEPAEETRQSKPVGRTGKRDTGGNFTKGKAATTRRKGGNDDYADYEVRNVVKDNVEAQSEEYLTAGGADHHDDELLDGDDVPDQVTPPKRNVKFDRLDDSGIARLVDCDKMISLALFSVDCLFLVVCLFVVVVVVAAATVVVVCACVCLCLCVYVCVYVLVYECTFCE